MKDFKISIIISLVMITGALTYFLYQKNKPIHTSKNIIIDSCQDIDINVSQEGDMNVNIMDVNSSKVDQTRQNDSQIKAIQSYSFQNGVYYCVTQGWDHMNITWDKTICGTFEYIEHQKKIEKKECEYFLYGKGQETSEKLNKLKNE